MIDLLGAAVLAVVWLGLWVYDAVTSVGRTVDRIIGEEAARRHGGGQ